MDIAMIEDKSRIQELDSLFRVEGTLPDERKLGQVRKDLYGMLGSEPYGTAAFETQSPLGESNRRNIVNWMLSLGDFEGHEFFKSLSANLKQISIDATTHKALERMYTGPERRVEADEEGYEWARIFMEGIHNSEAVRNRLRVVKSEFRTRISETLGRKSGRVDVLSIAAGSNRGMTEVVAELNGAANNRIQMRLVDSEQAAGDDAIRLATSLGAGSSIDFIREPYVRTNRYLEGYQPDFIEIVGLLDYVNDERMGKLLRSVYEGMASGATLLYSNITPNDEQRFTHGIVGWYPMIYRSAGDLQGFAAQAGFHPDNTKLITEPLGVYNLVSATK